MKGKANHLQRMQINHEKLKNMIIYFNKKDMTEFANHMMSEEVQSKKSEEIKNKVTHADFQNWLFHKNK